MGSFVTNKKQIAFCRPTKKDPYLVFVFALPIGPEANTNKNKKQKQKAKDKKLAHLVSQNESSFDGRVAIPYRVLIRVPMAADRVASVSFGDE